MPRSGSLELVRLDTGSATAIEQLVEKNVGCGNAMNLQTENGALDFLRHGLFCKAMFATARGDDPQSAQQCVAMGGDVSECPVFGMTPGGESRGEHGKLGRLMELQKKIAGSLRRSTVGNFSTVSGSELDPNRG